MWQQREVQPQLRKLLAMWEGIFPQQLLNVLKQRISQPVPAQSAGTSSIGQGAWYHSNQWSHSQGSSDHPASTSGRNGYHTESHVTGRPMSATYQDPRYPQHPSSFQQAPMAAQARSGPTQWPEQVAPVQYAAPQQPSSQPLVLPNLLSSLLSSGLLTVPASVSIAPAGAQAATPAVFYTHPQSRAATPEAVNAEDCMFVPSRLKVLSWSLCCICLSLVYCNAGVFCIVAAACMLLDCPCLARLKDVHKMVH